MTEEKTKKKRSKVGLLHGKIAWNMKPNVDCLSMGRYGQSAKSIGKKTKLSAGQIYNRLHQEGIKIWDFRNGENQEAQSILIKLKVVEI